MSGRTRALASPIPIENTAKAVLNDLLTLGRVRRPALGVRTIPIGPELADEIGLPVDYGLLIIQVTPGGSADLGFGMRGRSERRAYLGNIPIMLGGDLIVAIDDQKVQDEDDLAQMMNNHRARRHGQGNHLPRQEKNGRQRSPGRSAPAGVRKAAISFCLYRGGRIPPPSDLSQAKGSLPRCLSWSGSRAGRVLQSIGDVVGKHRGGG